MQENFEMRLSLKWLIPLFILSVAAPPMLFAQDTLPRFTSVDPASGKVGTVITVTGENIGKSVVAKLYFTDGQSDIEVQASDQTETTLKVKIPDKAKVGVRYKLMILTRGKEPKLIEQPVRIEVEE
jgi:hypothetical protein